MLALAYDAGLRREELCLLGTDDLDPAYRTITVRAETTKSRRSRVVSVFGRCRASCWCGYLRRSPADHDGARRVVRVRVAAEPRCRGVAVDVVEGGAVDRGARGRPGVQHPHAQTSVSDGSGAVGVGDRIRSRRSPGTARRTRPSATSICPAVTSPTGLQSGMTQIHAQRIAQIGEALT